MSSLSNITISYFPVISFLLAATNILSRYLSWALNVGGILLPKYIVIKLQSISIPIILEILS